MIARRDGPVALLSDPEVAPGLAAQLALLGSPLFWYATIEDLARRPALSSIAVLVVHPRHLPRGNLLVLLGRLHVEYPRMQKVAVMDGPPPLPVAEYLTACGVDLVWAEPGQQTIERLASVVDRMQERAGWALA